MSLILIIFRYFSLVVALHAETPEGSLPIVAHVSERIIVRVSSLPKNILSYINMYLSHRLPILVTLTTTVITSGIGAQILSSSFTM